MLLSNPTFTLLPPAPLVDAPLSSRLSDFLVARVSDPRLLGPLLSYLTLHLPLQPTAMHLRRVRLLPSPASVLLCPCTPSSLDAAGLPSSSSPAAAACTLASFAQQLREGSPLAHVRGVLGEALCGLEVLGVPVVSPRAREACAAESAALWPMVYRVPQGTAEEEALRAAAALSSAEAAYFASCLQDALRLAQAGQAAGHSPSGASIWLPGAPAPRGQGAARDAHNPFKTAVVEAIEDSAARDWQAAGCARRDAGAAEGPSAQGSRKRAREEAEEAAAGALSPPPPPPPPPPPSPPACYLCTGCDAFLTHEPGMGDAMALVHARVRRVVYLHSAPAGQGAFEGWGEEGVRLHWLKALNHHFLVYKCSAAVAAGAL
jgi:tRNA(Arg) A34 adenosine deaminase TadA